jgi:hypothetical protein
LDRHLRSHPLPAAALDGSKVDPDQRFPLPSNVPPTTRKTTFRPLTTGAAVT